MKVFNIAKPQISSDDSKFQNFTANFHACRCRGAITEGAEEPNSGWKGAVSAPSEGEARLGSRSGCPGRERAKSSRSERSVPAAGAAPAASPGPERGKGSGSGLVPGWERWFGHEAVPRVPSRGRELHFSGCSRSGGRRRRGLQRDSLGVCVSRRRRNHPNRDAENFPSHTPSAAGTQGRGASGMNKLRSGRSL